MCAYDSVSYGLDYLIDLLRRSSPRPFPVHVPLYAASTKWKTARDRLRSLIIQLLEYHRLITHLGLVIYPPAL